MSETDQMEMTNLSHAGEGSFIGETFSLAPIPAFGGAHRRTACPADAPEQYLTA